MVPCASSQSVLDEGKAPNVPTQVVPPNRIGGTHRMVDRLRHRTEAEMHNETVNPVLVVD